MTERALFPLRLYIYDSQGMHDGGIEIASESQLNGPGTRLIVWAAVNSGNEVRITDPDDFLVFHANNGEVLFPVLEAL